MKKIILIVIIGFTTIFIHAQNHKSYFNNGKLREVGTLKNNTEIGEWKWYYNNGHLESIGSYVNGHQIGEWREYYINGKIRRIRNFNNGFLTGEHKSFYDSGKLMLTGVYDKIGKKTEQWKRYHFSGKFMGATIYNKGKGYKNGKWTYYNEYGTLDKIENFKYGVKTGQWGYYDYKGKFYLTSTYKNGLFSGESREYYYNRELRLIKNYKGNLLQGEWKVYDENGSIVEIGNYFEDKKDGKWTSYYDKYQIEKEELWSEGKLMEVISFFDEKGNVLARGTLKNGNGTVKKYNSDGKLIKTVEYIYGEVFDWNNSTQLNNLAWRIYENETDIGVLKNAIKWVKRSIELDKNYYNTDTYAALLYKTGKYKQALIVAEEAIEIAKSNGDNHKGTNALIKDINVKFKK